MSSINEVTRHVQNKKMLHVAKKKKKKRQSIGIGIELKMIQMF